LGDEAISSRLKEETWVGVIDGLLKRMKAKQLKEGYVEAIAKVGDILAREFPIQPGDRNELPNTLVVKD
jgi:putative membrane protein